MKHLQISTSRVLYVLSLFSCFIFFLHSRFLHAQTLSPVEKVKKAESEAVQFESVSPFTSATIKRSLAMELDENVSDYDVLELNKESINHISKQAPEAVEMNIPSRSTNSTYRLRLVKTNPFTQEFQVIRASDRQAVDINNGVHYIGYVEQNENSLVTLSIFEKEVMGLISDSQGTHVLGKIESNDSKNKYVLYNDKKLLNKTPFECGTTDEGPAYKRKELEVAESSQIIDNCVRFYIEVDHDIYLNKGGMHGTYRYITGLMHQVRTIYLNEGVNTALSEILIWDIPSPYYGNSNFSMLTSYKNNTEEFNGDLAQLLSFKGYGGVSNFADICDPSPDQRKCFSSIQSSYKEIPEYSTSVKLIVHEFGHLFGSRHTHACVWNGNGTAIDGCAGTTEGSCSLPPLPEEGGTIMSYCYWTKNINLVFHPQPGNVIRNTVNNASCLNACASPSCNDKIKNGDEIDVDCGGSNCPPCPSCEDGIQNGSETNIDCGGPDCDPCFCEGEEVTFTIGLDDHPFNTSWSITSNDLGFGSGGRYYLYGASTSEYDFDTLTYTLCLDYGCYDLILYDGYGDGLCCNAGEGFYTLKDASGNLLASGGQFGYIDSTHFCISGPTDSFTVSFIDIQNESCPGNTDGSAKALAGWGTPPYSYAWSNSQTGKEIYNLAPGTYTVTATDANADTTTAVLVIGTDGSPGDPCDDGDPCTVNEVFDSNCNCIGTYQDSDSDGICDYDDICPGGDDNIDTDGDGLPNSCDGDHCTTGMWDFPQDVLTHSGPGESSMTLVFDNPKHVVSLIISDVDIRDIGKPSDRYIEKLFVRYTNVDGVTFNHQVCYGDVLYGNDYEVLFYSEKISSITLTLEDIHDGDAPLISINPSPVLYCISDTSCPDSDNDGVCDANDLCPGFDDALDNDGDGVPDGCDQCNGYDDTIDSDGDGVPDGCDICPGFDDLTDNDGDGVPDGCDVCPGIPDDSSECTGGSCTTETHEFPNTVLTSDGSPSSTTLQFTGDPREEVSFTISGLNAKTNGNPNGRFIDIVTVNYIDAAGANQTYGTFSGENVSSVDVVLPEPASSVTVSLEDGWDGNAPQTLQVNIGTVTSCIPPQALSKVTIHTKLNLVNVYPNPAHLLLHLELELKAPLDFDLVISDVNGRILQRQKYQGRMGFQKSNISLVDIPAGVYLMHIVTEEHRIVKRFVVFK